MELLVWRRYIWYQREAEEISEKKTKQPSPGESTTHVVLCGMIPWLTEQRLEGQLHYHGTSVRTYEDTSTEVVLHAAPPAGRVFLVAACLIFLWLKPAGVITLMDFWLISSSPEAKTGKMKPGGALAIFTWISCMYLKIYSCIFLRDESSGKDTARALCKTPHRLEDRFHPRAPCYLCLSPQLPPSACPLPWAGWGSACPFPNLQRALQGDTKDVQLILLVFHFGSNYACIFHFTFILCYAMISRGKSSERISFPSLGQYFKEGVLLSVKEHNP